MPSCFNVRAPITEIPAPGSGRIAFTGDEPEFRLSSSVEENVFSIATTPDRGEDKPAGALNTPRVASVARKRPATALDGPTLRRA